MDKAFWVLAKRQAGGASYCVLWKRGLEYGGAGRLSDCAQWDGRYGNRI
jgi:hypothetical protein